MRLYISILIGFWVGTIAVADPLPADFAAKQLSTLLERQEAMLDQLAREGESIPPAEQVRRVETIVDQYKTFIRHNPSNVEAYIFLGKFLRSVGQDKAANESFLKANQLDPDIAVVKQQIANYLIEEGNYTLAYRYLVSAIELEPDQAIYYYELAEFLTLYKQDLVDDEVLTSESFDYQLLRSLEMAIRYNQGARQLQLRYGEAFFDLIEPQWAKGIKVWIDLFKSSQDAAEQDYIRFNQARILFEMDEPGQANALLDEIVHAALEDNIAALRKEYGGQFWETTETVDSNG